MLKLFKGSPLFDWFNKPGAYVLVDGQFGSTGKGLMAAVIAEALGDRITHITTNAGPNSGHTAYYELADPHTFTLVPVCEKIMTQQIPVASVFLERMGFRPITILNGGAIVDADILANEVDQYNMRRATMDARLVVHPCAALISSADVEADVATVRAVAGTGKGIGPAAAKKVMRQQGILAITKSLLSFFLPVASKGWSNLWDWGDYSGNGGDRVFVETAQGFSLGINEERFYPNVTSRECTVAQALADARIPAQMLQKVIVCLRTFPIRVGSTENSSGACYEDQKETTWEALGLPPELTTVTKRVRRVFTWSRTQFIECVAANRPDILFLNFCNYLTTRELNDLINLMTWDYNIVMGHAPDDVLLGFGARNEDVITLSQWLEGVYSTRTRPEVA